MFKAAAGLTLSAGPRALLNLTQIRTATKKVSGSKTNKNDSAGRRLGPKAYEDHFVQTGQIIMRQRGTKIHPGENVDIGTDHTIYAMEPGYVKFYRDPFHPLRKFVGVSLKKEHLLPSPHFEPRLRRFGYVELFGEEAAKEEAHMCRKEYLAQPEIVKAAEKRAGDKERSLAAYSMVISSKTDLDSEAVRAGALRLFEIAQLLKLGQSAQQAAEQVTFNHIYDLQVAQRRGAISGEEFESQKKTHLEFVKSFDSTLSVDFNGKIFAPLSDEATSAKQTELLAKLDEHSNVVVTAEIKSTILALIAEPGVFSKAQRTELKTKYLPKVLPTTVPGTVVEVKPGKKLPKDTIAVRTLDPVAKKIETVVRTKEAFLVYST